MVVGVLLLFVSFCIVDGKTRKEKKYRSSKENRVGCYFTYSDSLDVFSFGCHGKSTNFSNDPPNDMVECFRRGDDVKGWWNGGPFLKIAYP